MASQMVEGRQWTRRRRPCRCWADAASSKRCSRTHGWPRAIPWMQCTYPGWARSVFLVAGWGREGQARTDRTFPADQVRSGKPTQRPHWRGPRGDGCLAPATPKGMQRPVDVLCTSAAAAPLASSRRLSQRRFGRRRASRGPVAARPGCSPPGPSAAYMYQVCKVLARARARARAVGTLLSSPLLWPPSRAIRAITGAAGRSPPWMRAEPCQRPPSWC